MANEEVTREEIAAAARAIESHPPHTPAELLAECALLAASQSRPTRGEVSKVIAAMQSGQLPMPTTEPAANPQAQEDLANLARQVRKARFIGFHAGNYGLRYYASDEQKLLIATALEVLSRPAADRGQIEACPFCGGDELNLADNEYRSRAIARLNNIARGQIVEECAKVVKARADFWNKIAREDPMRTCAESLADECEDIYAAVRALSPAPAQTEE